jgi:putative hemolysin
MNVGTRIVAVLPLLVVSACSTPGPVTPPQLPNPASVYCEEQGGRVEIVDTPEGQQGICVLPDGLRCEEWAFFRGECPCDGCPTWAPPAPGFCQDGTIVAGAVDACGCQMPPVCQRVPLLPAMTGFSGRYEHALEDGRTWDYAYDIHAAGTSSERRTGVLRADGLDAMLAAAEPGDRIQTPWGVMVRTPDSPHDRGFLLEPSTDAPSAPSAGATLEVPDAMLARGGSWKAEVGPWSYTVLAQAMGSRSERRIGRLRFGWAELMGKEEGDFVDTPWGRMRWLGPVDLGAATDYEQGFLLLGTRDRPLDDLEGDAVFPPTTGAAAGAVSLRLESLYLDPGIRVGRRSSIHSVSLRLSGDSDAEMTGTLHLDGNTCTLSDFGSKEICTLIAFPELEVDVDRLRLADPSGLARRIYRVSGGGLPRALRMIVQGELEQGELERCYLKLGSKLVPLYVDDGV